MARQKNPRENTAEDRPASPASTSQAAPMNTQENYMFETNGTAGTSTTRPDAAVPAEVASKSTRGTDLTPCPAWCDDPNPVKPDALPHEGHSHFSDSPGGYLPALLSVQVDGLTSTAERGVTLIAASAYRRESGVHPDGVHLHLTGGASDIDEVMLPFHARQLAHQLLVAADLAEGGAR